MCRRYIVIAIIVAIFISIVATDTSIAETSQMVKKHSVKQPLLFAYPEYGIEDKNFLMKFESDFMNTPEDKRIEFGIRTIQNNIANIQSRSLQARFRIFLSNLYLEKGRTELAKEQLNLTLDEYGDTGMGLLAGTKLLDLIQKDADYDLATQIAAKILDMPHLDSQQELHFAGRLSFFLITSGNVAEGYDVANQLIGKYPHLQEEIGRICENVAVTAGYLGNKKEYLEEMQWIHENLVDYSNSSHFLGNYAHACQENERNEEAIKLYLRIIEEFPDDGKVPHYILEVANLFEEQGDMLAAHMFYRQLLNIASGDEYIQSLQRLAETNIIHVERQLGIEQAKRLIENLIEGTGSWYPAIVSSPQSKIDRGIQNKLNSDTAKINIFDVDEGLHIAQNDSNNSSIDLSSGENHKRITTYILVVAGITLMIGVIILYGNQASHESENASSL